MPDDEANALLDSALDTPFRGWDFSALGDRITLVPPAWDFEQIVDDAAASAQSMLDLGTGGGEWLGARRHAPCTVATESWPPNVAVAAARLVPRGVPVVHDEGALDNVAQTDDDSRGRLAFRTGSFDLVVSRHEAFAGAEIRRVLVTGGRFVTQQADSGSAEFHALLGREPASQPAEFTLELAVEQLERAGFAIDTAQTGSATTVFADIGALAWYLTNVPWAVPGFVIDDHRDVLLALHGAPIPVTSARFLIEARA